MTKNHDGPINPDFFNVKCSVCGEPYDSDFYRCVTDGTPCYYTWKNKCELRPHQIQAALNGVLNVTWFCGGECALKYNLNHI